MTTNAYTLEHCAQLYAEHCRFAAAYKAECARLHAAEQTAERIGCKPAQIVGYVTIDKRCDAVAPR